MTMVSISASGADPRKHVLVFRSERPLAPLEVRIFHRRWHVEPEFSNLAVYAVTALADGSSCRPHALWIGDQEISLSRATSGLLVVQGPRVLVSAAGTEVCLSLEVRNEAHHPSDFCGTLLLGDWGELAADLGSYCQQGGPCHVPASGGACPGCNYPRAYAHPESLLDAFLIDQIYVRGTAVQVYPDPGVTPGLVQVVQRDGRLDEYPIPLVPEAPGRQAAGDPSTSLASLERHLLHASSRQLRAGLDSPAKILNPLAQARLLEHSASLMRSEVLRRGICGDAEGSLHSLALALADGVVTLSRGYRGYLDGESLHVLRRAAKDSQVAVVASEVRTILAELDYPGRATRVRSVLEGCGVVVDDRRFVSHPWASHAMTSPLLGAVSRIRVALLPDEADHVRIYDLRVVLPTNEDYSVLDHIPGYEPSAVREGPPARVGAAFVSRYLPGSILAGQLHDGVSLDHPYALSPSDLSGGVQVDLGRALPPLSRVCLVYQVEPGHLFCAVVEPA